MTGPKGLTIKSGAADHLAYYWYIYKTSLPFFFLQKHNI